MRFNERIRLAGTLIEDEAFAALLEDVLDVGADIQPSFFEVATAAAFLAFARTPADACIVEVGLGGRLDATNVIDRPAVCGIAALGVDHQQFLGSDPIVIAQEKAAIAKRGAPLVVSAYSDAILKAVAEIAEQKGAPLYPAFSRWHFSPTDGRLNYRDSRGAMTVPLPILEGDHQQENCALALAMLRHQDQVGVPLEAFERMPREAHWPARLQKLAVGPLTELAGGDVWIDGGHNSNAAERIAIWLNRMPGPRPLLVIGLLANKDARGFLERLGGTGCPMVAIPVADHECHDPAQLARLALELGFPAGAPAASLEAAISGASQSPVAILGSLYLAGEALKANRQYPD